MAYRTRTSSIAARHSSTELPEPRRSGVARSTEEEAYPEFGLELAAIRCAVAVGSLLSTTGQRGGPVYYEYHVAIIPLHEPEATSRRRPLQVMELALARIGADEAVDADHLASQSQQSDHEERPATSSRRPVIRIRPTVDFPLIWLTKEPSAP